jgi:hypothetical protein
MSKIRVLIGPKGQVKVAPTGFAGEQCVDATRFIEEALGTVTERTETDEMYEQEVSDELYEST